MASPKKYNTRSRKRQQDMMNNIIVIDSDSEEEGGDGGSAIGKKSVAAGGNRNANAKQNEGASGEREEDDRKPAAKPVGSTARKKSAAADDNNCISLLDGSDEENHPNGWLSPISAKKRKRELADRELAEQLQKQEDMASQKASASKEKRAMAKSNDGKAVLAVQEIIALVKTTKEKYIDNDPTLKNYNIEAVTIDDMVFFAKNMLDLQEEFVNKQVSGYIDVGYHYTDQKNMAHIRTHGLLTKGERSSSKVQAKKQNGSVFGDGIYTANSFKSFSGYGDTGLIVGRLMGMMVRAAYSLPHNQREKVIADTVVGDKMTRVISGRAQVFNDGWPIADSYHEFVLRKSGQCLPMIKYDKILRDQKEGKKCIEYMAKELQKILDKFFNKGLKFASRDFRKATLVNSTALPGSAAAPSAPVQTTRAAAAAAAAAVAQGVNNLPPPPPPAFLPAANYNAGTAAAALHASFQAPASTTFQPVATTAAASASTHTYAPAGKPSSFGSFARINPDGSVVPVFAPKLLPNGKYARPSGRQRKGWDWDADTGCWIPLPTTGLPSAAAATAPPEATQSLNTSTGMSSALLAFHPVAAQGGIQPAANPFAGTAAALQATLQAAASTTFQPVATTSNLTAANAAAPTSSTSAMPTAGPVRRRTVRLSTNVTNMPSTRARRMPSTRASAAAASSTAVQATTNAATANSQTLKYKAPKSLTIGIPANALTAPLLTCNMNDDCTICHDALNSSTCVALSACSHTFHKQCLELAFQSKNQCPVCRVSIGEPQGFSPSGKMTISTTPVRCSGFQCDSILIKYRIKSGVQLPYHSNPGQGHGSKNVAAYLPNDADGQQLLKRLKYSFMHGLSFTVGTSITTGLADQCTWSSVHHKTSPSGGVRSHGFPDVDYLRNCNSELDALSVPPANALSDNGKKNET